MQDYEESSRKCGENGIYKCGICECFPGFYGHNCECNNAQQKADESRCRPDNSSTVDCSGRGSCVCGKCECNTRSDLEVCCLLSRYCNYKYEILSLLCSPEYFSIWCFFIWVRTLMCEFFFVISLCPMSDSKQGDFTFWYGLDLISINQIKILHKYFTIKNLRNSVVCLDEKRVFFIKQGSFLLFLDSTSRYHVHSLNFAFIYCISFLFASIYFWNICLI